MRLVDNMFTSRQLVDKWILKQLPFIIL
jgi:hypothetical protein